MEAEILDATGLMKGKEYECPACSQVWFMNLPKWDKPRVLYCPACGEDNRKG